MHRCKYFYTTIIALSTIITTYMKEPLSEQDYLWESLKCFEEIAEIKNELAEITALAQGTIDDGNLKDTVDLLEQKAIEKFWNLLENKKTFSFLGSEDIKKAFEGNTFRRRKVQEDFSAQGPGS